MIKLEPLVGFAIAANLVVFLIVMFLEFGR